MSSYELEKLSMMSESEGWRDKKERERSKKGREGEMRRRRNLRKDDLMEFNLIDLEHHFVQDDQLRMGTHE